MSPFALPANGLREIAKAYRFRDTETTLEDLLTSHVGFPKVVENLLKAPYICERYIGKDASLSRMASSIRSIAREIEKLAPAVDRVSSPWNAEYPWEERDNLVVPCEYGYPNLRILKEPRGKQFLKFIQMIILDFDKISLGKERTS